jgi:hypothetical protein
VYGKANVQIFLITDNFKKNLSQKPNFESQVFSLNGAKGEVRPLVMALNLGDLKFKSQEEIQISIEIPKLDEKFRFELFRMPQIGIAKVSYAGAKKTKYFDPLVPIYKKWFSLQVEPLKVNEEIYFWIDLQISKEAPPGDYEGHVVLKSNQKKIPLTEVKLKLKVWDFSLPEIPSLPAYTELNPWYIDLAHRQYEKTKMTFLQDRYFKMLKAHGFYPLKSWVSHPQFSGSELFYADFNRLSQYSPKPIYMDFPAKAHFSYEFKNKNQVKIPTGLQINLQSKMQNEELYWKSVENWINQHQNFSFLTYFLDEPKPHQVFDSLKKLNNIRKWTPSLKIMMTTWPQKGDAGLIDIYAPLMNNVDKTELEKQNSQIKVWWYVSCMSHGCESLEDRGTPDFVIERGDSEILSIGVLSFVFSRIQAFLYYHANYNFQFKEKDPWKNLYHFGGNGDGFLFYPGRSGEFGLDEDVPVPSLRLKLWRESALLHQYLVLLREKRPQMLQSLELDKLFNSVKQWPHNSEYYYNLRLKIGNYLGSAKAVL